MAMVDGMKREQRHIDRPPHCRPGSGSAALKARLRRWVFSLLRAFASPVNGTVAMVLIAGLLWLIALAGSSHR
jgi:hypothetical protein